MNKNNKKNISLVVFLCTSFLCAAFGQKEDLKALYAQTLTSPDLSDAVRLANFTKITTFSNAYIAENAALRSLFINPDGRVLQRAKIQVDKFPLSESIRLRYAELLFENKNYTELLLLSRQIPYNFSSDDSRFRLLALQSADALGDSSYIELVISWFSLFPFDTNHAEFCKTRSFSALPHYVQDLCLARFYVYERDYIPALVRSKQFIQFSRENNDKTMYERLVLSDIGKAFLYGSRTYEADAAFFQSIGDTKDISAGEHVQFLAYFYAGRLYERASLTQSALRMLELSFSSAKNEDYDNALWYYLNLLEKVSLSKTMDFIDKTILSWYDPSYFADIVEKISVRLLTEKKWDDYYNFFTIIEDKSDPESQAKCAYICARLFELNYISPNAFAQNIPAHNRAPLTAAEIVKKLYEKAFYGNHVSMYYRVLAAEKLNIPIEDTQDSFFYRKHTENFTADTDVSELLLLYAQNGLFAECYSLFEKHADHIPLETASVLASLFAASGGKDPSLYPLSIRLILRSVQSVDTPLSAEVLKNMYPRFYADIIADAGRRYDLSEYLLYALVRSESLFDKDVVSHAGAVGLSQLMVPTAGDIGRKLRVTDYDLKDARTNAEFGAFYLRELIGRLDGSVMLSLFSYNAGISRVRNWVRNASQLPVDLFLETLPYNETRDYGRKILAAAAFYGYLYYGMSTHDIVAEIMR